jgi:hypothetical protein
MSSELAAELLCALPDQRDPLIVLIVERDKFTLVSF